MALLGIRGQEGGMDQLMLERAQHLGWIREIRIDWNLRHQLTRRPAVPSQPAKRTPRLEQRAQPQSPWRVDGDDESWKAVTAAGEFRAKSLDRCGQPNLRVLLPTATCGQGRQSRW